MTTICPISDQQITRNQEEIDKVLNRIKLLGKTERISVISSAIRKANELGYHSKA